MKLVDMPPGTGVEGLVENPRKRWAEETKVAIEFEEDPHRAALNDDPEVVYVGRRTWAAIFVSLAFHNPSSMFSSHTVVLRRSLCPLARR